MSNSARHEAEARRLQQASEWLIRLQEDEVPGDEIASWIDWCESNVENRKAFQNLLPLWNAFDERGSALQFSALARLESTPVKGPAYLTPRLAIAASVLLTLVAALFTFGSMKNGFVPRLAAVTTLRSEPGHVRPALLPDGSKLELGARSAVAIDFSGRQRQVEISDGEAFFSVKPDKHKPFVVRAGDVRVTAVGTQFNVQKSGDRVVVTVSEGSVRIDSGTVPAVDIERWPAALMASAGYQVIYDIALSSKPTMRAIDPEATTAWRQGRLEYLAEPLSSVIATLNRYSERSIVLDEPSLASLNYTGTIEVESVDEWLEALPRIFPVKVHQDNGQLRIARYP